jgi:hypothetical protein
MEIWKNVTVENYEQYEVSNLGNVRNAKGKILSHEKDRKGYHRVDLFFKNKRKHLKVHRLVALAFMPNPNNYDQVNHLDGIKSNNALYNLEWTNNKNNMIHAYNNGLSYNHRNEHGRFAKKIVNS